MPDFLYHWSLWWLNFWHIHPLIWWPMFILGIIGAVAQAKKG